MADQLLTTEESIIQGYLAPLAAGFPGAFGLKDDCAVAAPQPGCEFVLKTDAIAEGVHFLSTDPPADVGWKALAVNVSDLAAKGARPVGYLMSLSFPHAPDRAWMAGFAAGLGEAQAAFGMHLLGGDTDRRPGPVCITPMVIGEVPVGRMVRRGAAEPGDIVYVSGTIGDAGLGLRLLHDPAATVGWTLSAEQAGMLTARFRRPQPRLALAPAVLAHARAAMDLSDGLLKDLDRMCRASGVSATIEHAALPLSPAFVTVRSVAGDVAAAALFAGDDYEILTAVPPARSAAYEAAATVAGVAVTAVGTFAAPSPASPAVTVRDDSGRAMSLGDTGWDHF